MASTMQINETSAESRQYVKRAIEFKFKSVEDRFGNHRTLRGHDPERFGWLSETIGRIDREAKEYLELGRRSYYEGNKFEGHYYRNIAAAEEGETFERASKNCPTRDSSSYY